MITKPMLAGKCTDPAKLPFPVLATPKLDGIRCLKVSGKAVSRKFLPIGNTFIRTWIEANLPDGVDGELMVRGRTFSTMAGDIGRESGEPDFVFHIFDYVKPQFWNGPRAQSFSTYENRMMHLRDLFVSLEKWPPEKWNRVMKVLPVWIRSLAELEAYEAECLEAGYEGVMVRTPNSPYKCGRSTEREGWLLKIKRFEDAEAVVLDVEEGLSNQNVAEKDAFGRTKRSSAKDGLVGNGKLGSLRVRGLTGALEGREFNVGYNALKAGVDGVTIWAERAAVIGRVIRYRYQPVGMKELPRFPQFYGFREPWDIGGAV